jgi:hypothetical protein
VTQEIAHPQITPITPIQNTNNPQMTQMSQMKNQNTKHQPSEMAQVWSDSRAARSAAVLREWPRR